MKLRKHKTPQPPTPPLVHVYPTTEVADDRGTDELREVWLGLMRIVGRQRARKLRRRGVPVMRVALTSRGRHRHAWFTETT